MKTVFLVVLLGVAVFQVIPLMCQPTLNDLPGKSKIRDQRHVQIKIDAINEYLDKAANVTEAIGSTDAETKEAQNAADDFRSNAKDSFNFLKKAIADNTLESDEGKQLEMILSAAQVLEEWNDGSPSDSTNIKESLENSLTNYKQLVKETGEAFKHIKESAKNEEQAVNYLMDFLDNSLYLAMKLHYHLEHRSESNSELHSNGLKIVNQNQVLLGKIKEWGYKYNELIIHVRQLTFLLKKLIERINKWKPDKGLENTKTRTIDALKRTLTEAESFPSTDPSLENLTNTFQYWLVSISATVEQMDAVNDAELGVVARQSQYDVLGLLVYYNAIFANLAGSKTE